METVSEEKTEEKVKVEQVKKEKPDLTTEVSASNDAQVIKITRAFGELRPPPRELNSWTIIKIHPKIIWL